MQENGTYMTDTYTATATDTDTNADNSNRYRYSYSCPQHVQLMYVFSPSSMQIPFILVFANFQLLDTSVSIMWKPNRKLDTTRCG